MRWSHTRRATLARSGRHARVLRSRPLRRIGLLPGPGRLLWSPALVCGDRIGRQPEGHGRDCEDNTHEPARHGRTHRGVGCHLDRSHERDEECERKVDRPDDGAETMASSAHVSNARGHSAHQNNQEVLDQSDVPLTMPRGCLSGPDRISASDANALIWLRPQRKNTDHDGMGPQLHRHGRSSFPSQGVGNHVILRLYACGTSRLPGRSPYPRDL